MPSLNRVFLMGNLTRDPELRYIPSGTPVTTFTIALNRFYSTQAGEKKEEVTFVRVVVWGRRAEVCGEYLSKGSPVFVEGRIRSRSWEDQNGQKRSTIEVVASNVQFLRLPAKQEGALDIQGLPPEDVGAIDLGGDVAIQEEGLESSAQPPEAVKDDKEEDVPF